MTLPPIHPLPLGDTTVRAATSADIPACAEILDIWTRASDWAPRYGTRPELEARLAAGLDTHTIWVLGDPVLGFLAFDPATCEIVVLCTRYDGLGHGRALMDHAKAQADTLYISHHLANLPAQTFCRSQGFVPLGESSHWPGTTHSALRMEWWKDA